jgi:hypothetical protein
MIEQVRNLEGVVYEVARAVGVSSPERLNISDALQQTRKWAGEGIPPWARGIASEEVSGWTASVKEIFKRRNAHVHWHHYLRAERGGWKSYRSSEREPRTEPVTAGDLSALHDAAFQMHVLGSGIERRLMFEIRPGVFLLHPTLAREEDRFRPMAYYSPETGWPARPTPEEITAWYDNLVTNSPADWATWPIQRLAEQQPG